MVVTSVSINQLVEMMTETSGIRPTARHDPPRPGDVRDSLADISAAKKAFGFQPTVTLQAGLSEYMSWAKEETFR